MADRKEELARKKAKLEELRRQREERKGHTAAAAASVATPTKAAAPPSIAQQQASVDDVLNDILGADKPTATSQADVAAAPSTPMGTPRRAPSGTAMRIHRTNKMSSLGHSEIFRTSFDPKESITYSKGVQTDETEEDIERREAAERKAAKEEDEESRGTDTAATAAAAAAAAAAADEGGKEPESEPEPEVTVMPAAQAAQVMGSDGFQEFFDRATRVVERALCEKYDVTVDYSGNDDEEGDHAGQDNVLLHRQFTHPRWTHNRTVTSMDWCEKFPELLAVSYNGNVDAPNDPDGLVLVWNTHLPDRPEFIFQSQSAVLSTCFVPFSPNVIVGGTYSGQIVLWDNRTKRTPVQRSSLSADGHTHPVYCTRVVGTQNAHNLVTISTDGKMCTWNLDMLNTPQEKVDLQAASKAVSPTCLSAPTGDINSFVIGSEEGPLYSASRHGSQAGVCEAFEGHGGPITGVNFHRASGSIDFSHLFLSSSTDWTVKLWSSRSKQPLYSFEDADDYVYDVQWSPAHPSLFVTGDGMGRLDFWNLNVDTEVPVVRTQVGEGKQAVNRVSWSSDGRQLACGLADGSVYVYNIGEKLAVPRLDEWSRFNATLTEIQNAAADAAAASAIK